LQISSKELFRCQSSIPKSFPFSRKPTFYFNPMIVEQNKNKSPLRASHAHILWLASSLGRRRGREKDGERERERGREREREREEEGDF
jgi:hypothetical protein